MKKSILVGIAICSVTLAKAQQKVQDSLADFDYVHFKEHLSEIKDKTARENYLHTVQRNFIKRKYNLVPEKTYKSSAVATSTCGNFDFEDGNVAGWTMAGDFQIMSGSGVDPYGGFPVVAPGGSFSLRLNDDNTACSGPTPKVNFTAAASKTLIINPSNANIKVGFAACFLKFPHPQNSAGNLKIRFYDQLDSLIPSLTYSVCYASPPNSIIATSPSTYSTALDSGAQVCNTVKTYYVDYLPWQSEIFNLSAYTGQMVKIKLSADWCTYDYDWAYAYFDVCCDSGSCNQISARTTTVITSNCMPSAFSSTLCASTTSATNYLWANSTGTLGTSNCLPVNALSTYTLSYKPVAYPTYTFYEVFKIAQAPTITFTIPGTACSNVSSSVPLFVSPAGGTFSGPGVSGNSFKPWTVANGTYTITYNYTDPTSKCNGVATHTILVSTCTGINAINNKLDLILAPNPFRNEIVISSKDLPESCEFILVNTLGQEILRKRLTNDKNTVDTEGIPQGLYIYSVIHQNKTLKQGKLVKD